MKAGKHKFEKPGVRLPRQSPAEYRAPRRVSATEASRKLIIAATAIARGLDVVTRDERSFPRMPRLPLIRW